jgi:hypothetical protein
MLRSTPPAIDNPGCGRARKPESRGARVRQAVLSRRPRLTNGPLCLKISPEPRPCLPPVRSIGKRGPEAGQRLLPFRLLTAWCGSPSLVLGPTPLGQSGKIGFRDVSDQVAERIMARLGRLASNVYHFDDLVLGNVGTVPLSPRDHHPYSLDVRRCVLAHPFEQSLRIDRLCQSGRHSVVGLGSTLVWSRYPIAPET